MTRGPASAGHFTTLQVRGGLVQGRDLHLERLCLASNTLYGVALDQSVLRSRIREALLAEGMGEGDCTLRIRIRPDVPTGAGEDAGAGDLPVLLAIDIEPPRQPSPQPLRLRAHPGPRTLAGIKHLALDHQLEARRAAQAAGCDDALFVTADGRIAEGTFWNIALWDGETVTWPEGPALSGVTMSLLRQALAKAAIPQRSAPVPLDVLPAYRAAFAVNSTGIQDIASIDGHAFPGDTGFAAALRALLAASPWDRF